MTAPTVRLCVDCRDPDRPVEVTLRCRRCYTRAYRLSLPARVAARAVKAATEAAERAAVFRDVTAEQTRLRLDELVPAAILDLADASDAHRARIAAVPVRPGDLAGLVRHLAAAAYRPGGVVTHGRRYRARIPHDRRCA